VRRKNQNSANHERAGSLQQEEAPAETAHGRRSAEPQIRLLLLLDDSPASKRMLRYMKRVVETGAGFHIVLLQLLPYFPPELLEHGGSENPATEKRLDAELRQRQHEWISNARRSAEQNLQKAIAELSQAGAGSKTIEMLCCQPEEGGDAVDFLLGVARESGCQTVVVAGPSLPNVQESSVQKLGAALLRRRCGVSVWAIT
jgi:hypothetical protein